MKTKESSKKLHINKTTIAALNNQEKAEIKGGVWYSVQAFCWSDEPRFCTSKTCDN